MLEKHLGLLCKGKAAGNYALCQPWRLQKAHIWSILGVLFPLLTQLTNFKVLVADRNFKNHWFLYFVPPGNYRAKYCMYKD